MSGVASGLLPTPSVCSGIRFGTVLGLADLKPPTVAAPPATGTRLSGLQTTRTSKQLDMYSSIAS